MRASAVQVLLALLRVWFMLQEPIMNDYERLWTIMNDYERLWTHYERGQG